MAPSQSHLTLFGKDINYHITESRRIILRMDLDSIDVNLATPGTEVRIWGLKNRTSDYVSITNYYETGDRYLEMAGWKLLLWAKGPYKDVFQVEDTYKQVFVNIKI